jgi:uncharacterized protein DUF222
VLVENLRAAVAELESLEGVDPRELSALIDRQQAVLCRVLREGVKRGEHLLEGKTPCAWVAAVCRVSGSSAGDRLRVGEELQKLPAIEAALRGGEIGFQATAVICHLSELLGEKGEQIVEEDWVGYARQFSIQNLRRLAEHARFVVDPEGAERDAEEDYEQRYLFLSELGSMYKLDAVLDREGGMALKSALESLTKRLGPTDERSPKQRRGACKLVPLCYHHHRLVHEGCWQVVLAGERVEFIPPDTPVMFKRRWGERRWAA